MVQLSPATMGVRAAVGGPWSPLGGWAQRTSLLTRNWVGRRGVRRRRHSFVPRVGAWCVCGHSLVGSFSSPASPEESGGARRSPSSHRGCVRTGSARLPPGQTADLAVSKAVVTGGTQSSCLNPSWSATRAALGSTPALTTEHSARGGLLCELRCRPKRTAMSRQHRRP